MIREAFDEEVAEIKKNSKYFYIQLAFYDGNYDISNSIFIRCSEVGYYFSPTVDKSEDKIYVDMYLNEEFITRVNMYYIKAVLDKIPDYKGEILKSWRDMNG
jgi:hypothetical protein